MPPSSSATANRIVCVCCEKNGVGEPNGDGLRSVPDRVSIMWARIKTVALVIFASSTVWLLTENLQLKRDTQFLKENLRTAMGLEAAFCNFMAEALPNRDLVAATRYAYASIDDLIERSSATIDCLDKKTFVDPGHLGKSREKLRSFEKTINPDPPISEGSRRILIPGQSSGSDQ